MLHILNGETTEQLLAQTGIAGAGFSFCDALIDGPAPAAVAGAEWRRLRATHLSAAYDVETEKCERDLAHQEDIFAKGKNWRWEANAGRLVREIVNS